MSTTPTQKTIRAEARECSCGHIGINDSHETLAACNRCEWSGPSPKEDHCPECERDGTMVLACPECGGVYTLLCEADINVDRAALTQGAGEAVEPVAWPRDAAEVRQFMNSNCESVEFAVDEATPNDGDRYQLTAHDFLSAVNWWADFPHHPSEEAAQQLQQAVAREREECAAICERAVDSIWEYHEENHKRTGRNVCTNLAAAIRAKGTHD